MGGDRQRPGLPRQDFNRAVLATAAKPQRIRSHTPKHNGKVERYNRTLAAELLYTRECTPETQGAAALDLWNIHYNYHRLHTAAGDRPQPHACER